MYEFCFGIIIGYVGGWALGNRTKRSVGTQADELVPASQPVPVPNFKRKFTPGELENFWS